MEEHQIGQKMGSFKTQIWQQSHWGGGGVLTYLAERGCAALMGHFFTGNP